MYCKNCGKEIDGKFCSSCGTNNEVSENTMKNESGSPEVSSNNTWNTTSNNINKPNLPKKPVFKKWWFWVIIAILIIGIGANLSDSENKTTEDKNLSTSQGTDISKNENDNKNEYTSKDDLSSVAKEYTLTAGNYVSGIDLPAGECDVIAISGNGNLSSSNMYSGGVNEVFGIDDGSGFYTSSFNGLKLPKNTTISLNGNLVIKLSFSKVESNFKGRTYDENNAIELNSGNYVSGTDFPSGSYKIIAVSGTGNISSSNIYDGGINEVFGVDDGSGFYNNQFLNAELSEGVTLTVSGGLSIKLIPAKNN